MGILQRFLALILSVCCLSASAALVPNIFATNGQRTLNIITPSTGVTNSSTAEVLSAPTTTSEAYPYVFQLGTNQSFVIQDEFGNNIFGIRHDAYGTTPLRRNWEISFGSKQQGVLDQIFDLTAGADIAWRINGDIQQAFVIVPAVGKGLEMAYANTNYFDLYSTLNQVAFDSWGQMKCNVFSGDSPGGSVAPTIGAAAGTGGSVGVTADDNQSDVSFQITIVTGHTATGIGTVATYNLENAPALFNTSLATTPTKPVFSAANAAAANEITKFFVTGSGTAVTISARAALTIDTTYVLNVIVCR